MNITVLLLLLLYIVETRNLYVVCCSAPSLLVVLWGICEVSVLFFRNIGSSDEDLYGGELFRTVVFLYLLQNVVIYTDFYPHNL